MRCPSCKTIQRSIMAFVNASPIMLLLVIFSWSYYAYNVSLSYYGLIAEGQVFQGLAYIFIYHPILILCMWSYYTVCKTSPGYTLDMYKKRDEETTSDQVGLLQQQPQHQNHFVAVLNIQEEEEEEEAQEQEYNEEQQRHHTPITVKRDGAKRYCQKCKIEKFDRTHHCRQCKRCVLKMDHHCPWINNCVGYFNYKSFYLFLAYATLYCIYVFSTTLPITIIQSNGPLSILGLNINCALLVFISGLFGLFLIPFTIFHTRQLCKNRTTIEFYEKANYRLGNSNSKSRDILRSKYFNPWDLGTRKNVQQVLGKNFWKMFIPISKTLGDGFSFPINSYAYDTLGNGDDDDFSD